jgi:hypothetical protein
MLMVKVRSSYGRYEGMWMDGGIAPRILNIGTISGEWSASHRRRLNPGRGHLYTHWGEGWVGPSASLDFLKKVSLAPAVVVKSIA